MMDTTHSTREREDKRISVFCLITALTGGGAETVLYRLMSRLDRTKFNPQVVSMIGLGPVSEKIRALGIQVRSLGMSQGIPNPLAVLKLVRWLQCDKPDVIQTWMYHADLLGGLAARLAGGIPVSWGIRHSDLSVEGNRRLTLLTVKACAPLSRWLPTKIVCCSEASREVHAAVGYATEKMIVIPNGIDPELFRPNPNARATIRRNLGIPDDAPIIGMVGRFDPQKDHYNFIQAAQRLYRSQPDARFLLCGEEVTWENAELVKWIEDAGIRERCFLLGKRDDIPDLTTAFDIATLSSMGEGFPNVVIEAMACGVPCVVTDVGESARIVANTGTVVPRRDPQALADAWHAMLKMDRTTHAQLGLAARRRVMEEYGLSQIVSRYESLFEELACKSISQERSSSRRAYVRD
jgi:glycosyltransferase involved in cell wall biosynthesis